MNDAVLRRAPLFATVLLLVAGGIALGGCQQATAIPEAAPTAEATAYVEPTQEPLATETSAVAAITSTVASTVTVMVTTNATYGDILTDGTGRTLYLNTADSPGLSTCTGTCAETWPPLTVTGTAEAGAGATASMLGTLIRDDGTTQVSYNGWPLYYYGKDTGPGETTGQDVAGTWYVVSPKGEKVESPSS